MKTIEKNSRNVITGTILIAGMLCMVQVYAMQFALAEKFLSTAESESQVKPPKMDIFTAALFGDVKTIKQHIAAGTDLNQKDAYGSTALIIAATFGKTEVAEALIEGGADVNVINNDGGTALHAAAFLCRTDIVKALLENGIDKNIRNNYGSTARESVLAPFKDVKPIYDQFSKDLGPLGLKLDYSQIEETRPIIATLLQ